MLVSGDLRGVSDSREGSFCPSPKSVTQQSQPGAVQAADLYFPVFLLLGLSRQTGEHLLVNAVGKGFPPSSALVSWLLLSLWVTCAIAGLVLQFLSHVLGALSPFLRFLLSITRAAEFREGEKD